MKKKFDSFDSIRCRSGLTLIEVIAGLAILSTLLVSVLIAISRHERQIKRAERVLDAANVADRVLAELLNHSSQINRQQAGTINNDETSFRWEISDLRRNVVREDFRWMQLEVFDQNSSQPLVTVAFVIPEVSPW